MIKYTQTAKGKTQQIKVKSKVIIIIERYYLQELTLYNSKKGTTETSL